MILIFNWLICLYVRLPTLSKPLHMSIVNAISTWVWLQFFHLVYLLPKFFFTLAFLDLFLDACHICFGHVMGARSYVTCYKTMGTCFLACCMPLGTCNMGCYGCKPMLVGFAFYKELSIFILNFLYKLQNLWVKFW